MYIIPGSSFETVSALIITLPVVFPLIVGLGDDPIWWGMIIFMVIEIGQTTPIIGIIPFFFADLTRLAIIAIFPILALWLPGKLGMLLN